MRSTCSLKTYRHPPLLYKRKSHSDIEQLSRIIKIIFQLWLHGWTMSRHRRHRQLKCQNIVNFSKVKLMAKILLLSDGVLCRSEHIKWLPNWRWETGTLLAWPRVMNHPMKISEITVRMFCQIGTIWICSSSDCNIIIFVTPGKMRCVDLEIKINLLTEFHVMQQCYIELENIFLFAKTCGDMWTLHCHKLYHLIK